MRLVFTLHDTQEISASAVRAFISTFNYRSDESEPDSSDSDLSDFEPDRFGCPEITPEVENMVKDNWQICDPLNEVYGTTTCEIIKETVRNAKEETQCAGLNFFKDITPSEDPNLLETCTAVCFWCCCETVKKVSPIIAEATTNLIY